MNKETYFSRLEDFFSGSFTGAVTRFIIAPLDVVKIRLQTQFIRYGREKYHGIIGTMSSIVHEEGLTRLWSGNLTAEIYWFLYSGVQFSCYEFLQHTHTNLVSSSFSSGALSSAVTTLITYPFDILRTRFVYQGKDMYYKHILTGFASIIRDEGILGLYKGLFPCLISIMPYMGSCFYIVEFLRSQYGDTPAANSLYGTVSGAISKLLVYPLDTGKKLLQVYQLNPGKSVGMFLRDHYHLTGFRGLYAGVMAAMLKSGLSSGLLFGFYTLAKTFFSYGCLFNKDEP